MSKRNWFVVLNVVDFFVGFPIALAVFALLVMRLGWFFGPLSIVWAGTMLAFLYELVRDSRAKWRSLDAMGVTRRRHWSRY